VHTASSHKVMLLSDRDWEVSVDAMVRPPKPHARLRHAFRLARRIVS